jgi:hypothetical protein
MGLLLFLMMMIKMMKKYDRMHPLVELDDAAFPLLMLMMLSKTMPRKTRLILIQKQQHLQKSQLQRSIYCLKLLKGRFPFQ